VKCWTYRKNNVDQIHDAENHDADTGVIISVGEEKKGAGKNVMCEHFPIVFTFLLDIDHDDLLQPETPLGEVVELGKTSNLPVRPPLPHAVDVEPELGMVHDVLFFC
jgi:hypothetical protein